MSNGPHQGNRLRTVADLTERHMGRTVTCRELTGRLDGLLPLGDRVALVLLVGGARVWTELYPRTEHVEIHQKEAS